MAPRDVDVERREAARPAGHGLVVQAQRLRRQLAQHPRARRASSQRVSISPFTSSSACSVDACAARASDLIADRPAERARQVARGVAPLAAVDARRSAASTAAAPTAAALASCRAPRARLAADTTLHSPVIDADGVGELLRRQPPHFGPGEHVPARRRLAGPRDRRHLVRARGQDRRDQPLHVVAVLDEIAGEPVEQRRAPRLAVHLVRVGDDAVAEQALPEAVDQRARQPAVARIGEDRRRRRAPIGQRARRRLRESAPERETRARRTGPARRRSGYSCSFGSGAKYAASAYASFSFHLLTKLSWHALHFRLMPRNTCAVFCDACIHGVTAALVSPRQFTPTRNPSGSPGAAGFSSFVTNWSYGRLVCERRQQPVA